MVHATLDRRIRIKTATGPSSSSGSTDFVSLSTVPFDRPKDPRGTSASRGCSPSTETFSARRQPRRFILHTRSPSSTFPPPTGFNSYRTRERSRLLQLVPWYRQKTLTEQSSSSRRTPAAAPLAATQPIVITNNVTTIPRG